MRVAGEDTSLLAIDRENEVHNTIAAAEVGVGARVVAYLPEHGALVLEFIEGRTQFRRGPAPRRQAALVRMPAGGCTARGASATISTCSRSSAATSTSCGSAGFAYRTAISSSSPRCVRSRKRCGSRRGDRAVQQRPARGELHRRRRPFPADRLRVLGEQRRLLRARQRLERVEPLARAARPADRRVLRPPAAEQGGASPAVGPDVEVRLDAWGSIQEGISSIDFDFWAWSMEKYERAVQEFDSPGFDACSKTCSRGS